MTATVLYIDRWNYSIEIIDGIYLIDVCFCNQIVDYSVYYTLTQSEIEQPFESLGYLADNIRNNTETYESRKFRPCSKIEYDYSKAIRK